MLNAVELFAGAGGLGMGISLAGFEPQAVIEWDRWACDTIRENAYRGYPVVMNWPLSEGDIRHFDYSSINQEVDLIAGGPPCQPFSLGGKHKAQHDERDMFPATVAIVRRLRPRAFIIENVKGLTRSAFTNYFQYICLQFSFPELYRRKNEDWLTHMARLERKKTSGKRFGLTYEVVTRVLNAADFGVPQKRERVFIVGFRKDLGIKWAFPDSTHSFDALLFDQWVTGEYWDRHEISIKDRPPKPDRYEKRIERLRQRSSLPDFLERPWHTVRDALDGIPDPREKGDSNIFLNHKFQPGARQYKGHTGSPLDFPAKALKAGDHGVPGGENMMVLPNGDVRYFTVREAARIQTFPDGYVFHGAWSETMRQLGNAVPVKLAQTVAASVAEKLVEQKSLELGKLVRQIGRG